MDNVRFAQTIKNARLKKGYTQSQLADLLKVSNKTISKWETGVSQTKDIKKQPMFTCLQTKEYCY